jgi:hypothetical protein
MTTAAGPHLADGARRGGQVRLAGQLARFLVVEQQHVDALEQAQQLRRLPSIQKFIVSHATKRGLRAWLQHVELQAPDRCWREHVLRIRPRRAAAWGESPGRR